MRSYRKPVPLQLDTTVWDYSGARPVGSQSVKPIRDLFNEVIWYGAKIKGESGLGYSSCMVIGEGRDGYRKEVHAGSPADAIEKLHAHYVQHLEDTKDTALLLQAYREGRVVNS